MIFLLRALACWRLAYMLVNEEGPNRIFQTLRRKSGIEHDADGKPIAWTNDLTPLWCVWCTSLWISPLILLLPAPILSVLSCSGAVCLLQAVYEKVSSES